MGTLGAGREEALGMLESVVVVDSTLEVGTGVDSTMLEAGGAADAEEDGATDAEEDGVTDDWTACDEDTGIEDTKGVPAGTDDGDGKTVVYCVTRTTGGTGKDVEGRNSAAVAELEDKAGVVCAPDLEVTDPTDESAKLAEGSTSDAAGVGKTVI